MENKNRSNKLVVPGAKQVLNQFKYEIASEFGVTLGSQTSARQNGSVGGEMTKRLIAEAQATRANNSNNG
ncbi:alpha/beta-type small acid-soluble spore protein [Mycoplasmatota bacterium]|nr:alpha/beta-type small acid-soluble spore protein [Mycoplasmatota bacterium]